MVPSIMVRCVLSDVVASVMKCRCVFLRVKVSVVSMRPYACLVSDVPFGKNRGTTKKSLVAEGMVQNKGQEQQNKRLSRDGVFSKKTGQLTAMFVLKVLWFVYLGLKWSHFKRVKILLWIYRKFQSKVLLS